MTDEDLRARLQELGRREAAAAPRLEGVLRARRRPARAFGPVLAAAGLLLVTGLVTWWPARTPNATLPEVSVADWVAPTDVLLADAGEEAGRREAARLSREIEGLLQ